MKKFLFVSGIVLIFIGLFLAFGSFSVSLNTGDKFFLYFLGWTKDYTVSVFVAGTLLAVTGAITALEAYVSMF